MWHFLHERLSTIAIQLIDPWTPPVGPKPTLGICAASTRHLRDEQRENSKIIYDNPSELDGRSSQIFVVGVIIQRVQQRKEISNQYLNAVNTPQGLR